MVRDRTDAVIAALQDLERDHRRRGDACYYEVRDRRFNPLRATLAAGQAGRAANAYTPALAAMLIFLNRTGFNGLFRLTGLADSTWPAAAIARRPSAIRATSRPWPPVLGVRVFPSDIAGSR